MLGEGLRAGLAHMGIPLRTVAYLEREAYPAACLAARIEESSLDGAPVWPDLLTFDAGRWAGAVDGIVAGFPCQDLSLAGRRAGLDGKRSGLFFNILDIAHACGAWFLFLENVAGIASATASVVDEAEGALEERAAARVVGELADRGWHAEWLTLSASDVGASHGRERWFCFAWRDLGNAGLQHQHLQQREDGSKHPGAGCAVGDPHDERTHRSGTGAEQYRSAEPANTGGCVANTEGLGRHKGRAEPSGQQGRPDVAECGCAVADTERQCGKRRGEPGHLACTGCEAERQTRQRQRSGPAADGGCCAVADTSRPGQQGRELGTALHGNRGGGASTWTS
jgi:DNA (cytosine-5)-methyltransferase 1